MRQKLNVTLSLKVTDTLKRRLKIAADREARSMNWLATDLIDRGLRKIEKTPSKR